MFLLTFPIRIQILTYNKKLKKKHKNNPLLNSVNDTSSSWLVIYFETKLQCDPIWLNKTENMLDKNSKSTF